MDKIIGAVHFMMVLLVSFFFVVPKSKFDFLFLAYEYTVFWSWTMLNGQCPVSYCVKKPNDTSISSGDIILLFGEKHAPVMKTVLKCCALGLNTVSLIVVLLRNKMNVWIGVTPILVYHWLRRLQLPVIHLIFWFIFPFFIVDSVRRYFLASTF